MEIKKKYYNKYLHEIAIEQLIEEYTSKGFKTIRDKRIGDLTADLFAENQKEKIIIEVKTSTLTSSLKQKIKEISKIANRNGYKYLIYNANPPEDKKILIDGIEEIFSEYFLNDFPSELDSLSTQTRISEISNINFDNIEIFTNIIHISGFGAIGVKLQYGSDFSQVNDNGESFYDSYPFTFDVNLKLHENKLTIDNVEMLDIDTSSFYE